MSCNILVEIVKSCDDNNLGAIKKAWIADYDDVNDYTETDALVSAVTMETGTMFYEFAFKKNTSSYVEPWAGDITADVHMYAPSISIGLRRIEIAKRNAITLLAEGRRQLVVIVQDNNDTYRIFGLDDGLRLTAMDSGTNEAKSAGTFYTITLSGEEKWMAYDIEEALLTDLTIAAV